ncbi:MAG: hypothetical protein KAW47_03060 [Thermoplasmatales archaeon]|nr:hypothetical protein [Thermoplasmatales archaeon]
MAEIFTYRKRQVTTNDVQFIRNHIAKQPAIGRCELSRQVLQGMGLGATQRISQGYCLPWVDAQAGTGRTPRVSTKKNHTNQSSCPA